MSKEAVGSGFSQLNKSPEALAATREQMIREQLNKAANLVVAFYKNSGDLARAGLSEKDLKQKVMASPLFIEDIGVILRDAYTRQDQKNPHAYDNEYTLPYVVESDEKGLLLRASPELKKERWENQHYDLKEYKEYFFEKEPAELLAELKEEVKNIKVPEVSSVSEPPISEAAKETYNKLVQNGVIDEDLLKKFGNDSQKQRWELERMIDRYQDSTSPTKFNSVEEYIETFQGSARDLLPYTNKGKIEELDEKGITLFKRLIFISTELREPTEEELGDYSFGP